MTIVTIFIIAIYTLYFAKTVIKDRWEILAFDVGQGTSIVVRQHSQPELQQKPQYMIYDTGPAFRGGFSMAQAVLMPYFEGAGLPEIAYLVLSHLDNDHAGGAYFLENNLRIHQTISPSKGCNGYQSRQWQSLRVQILWPLLPQSGDENNHSCVIKLSSAHFSVLLAGDIEKPAEASIIERYRGTNILNADILVAPHHGSKTSSTQSFVDLVAPQFVIFTAGYNNRWSFPDQAVVLRYTKKGALAFNTGRDGRIQLRINDKQIEASRYRQDDYPRWYFLARESKHIK